LKWVERAISAWQHGKGVFFFENLQVGKKSTLVKSIELIRPILNQRAEVVVLGKG
jgi:hypothetical protein